MVDFFSMRKYNKLRKRGEVSKRRIWISPYTTDNLFRIAYGG
jgi:hypothetical protein